MSQQVDEADAANSEGDSLGATLRAARQGRGMSLQELAAKSGVSVGMISQIERGIANPSMRLLTSLRRSLDLSMGELFGEVSPVATGKNSDAAFVRRSTDRSIIDLGSLKKQLLTPGGRGNLQIMILQMQPGAHSGGNTISYPAEKGGVVLSGQVVLTVDGIDAVLSEGDSFAFDSIQPHSVRNDTTAHAEVLWIIGAVRFDRNL